LKLDRKPCYIRYVIPVLKPASILSTLCRILQLNRAQWRIEHRNYSTSKLVSLSTRKWTFGLVAIHPIIPCMSDMPPQSLGCTLYAMAYSHSPFENTQTTEQGGSIAMAVLNAQYKHPSSQYSKSFRELIDMLLKVNPKERPDIHQVNPIHDLRDAGC